MRLICEHCQRQFEAQRKRACCDRKCSAQMVMRMKGLSPWSLEETEHLRSLAGQYPLAIIVSQMQRFQEKQGWLVRSETAIHVKFSKLRLSRKSVYDNFNRYELARILDVDNELVRRWTNRFGLPFRKGKTLTAISISGFKAWAYEHPELLAGIEAERLDWLIDDADFCLRVAAQPKPKGCRTPVRRKDTGKTYRTMRAAEKEVYVTHGCIRRAILSGGRSAGVEWELVEDYG